MENTIFSFQYHKWKNYSTHPLFQEKYRSFDITFRKSVVKKLLSSISSFSRNIDKIIEKRVNYR